MNVKNAIKYAFKLCITLVALIYLSVFSYAQQRANIVEIRTNEHADFTRLVIETSKNNISDIVDNNDNIIIHFNTNITQADIVWKSKTHKHLKSLEVLGFNNALQLNAKKLKGEQVIKTHTNAADADIANQHRVIIDIYPYDVANNTANKKLSLDDISDTAYNKMLKQFEPKGNDVGSVIAKHSLQTAKDITAQTAKEIKNRATASNSNGAGLVDSALENLENTATDNITNAGAAATKEIIHNSLKPNNALAQSSLNVASNVASEAVKAGLDASINSTNAQSDIVSTKLGNIALNSTLNEIKEAGTRNNIHALSHMEAEITLSKDNKPQYSFLTVVPLWEAENQNQFLFTQLNIANKKDDLFVANRTTGNMGLGYRYLTHNKQWLLGGNIFYDHEFPLDHQRIGIGAEAITSLAGARTNFYQPISGWRNRNDFFQEHALQGVDAEISGRLPQLPELQAFVKGFWYNKHKTLQDNGADIYGTELSIEYSPVPFLTLRSASIKDNESAREYELAVQLKYQLGMPFKEQWQHNTAHNLQNMYAYRWQKIRRENAIRVQVRQNPNTVGTITTTIGNNIIVQQGNTSTLAVGGLVLFGARITVEDTVADTSGAIVTFGDGAVLTIGDGTIVDINEGTITLISGVIRYTSNGSTRNINTPGGTITLLGTTIEAMADNTGSITRVTEGQVDFASSAGTLRIPTGSTGGTAAASILPTLRIAGDALYDALIAAIQKLFGENATAGVTDPFSIAGVAGTIRTLTAGGVNFDVRPINASGRSFYQGCQTQATSDALPATDPLKGKNIDPACTSVEQPLHVVTFANSFEVALTETTNQLYQACVTAGTCTYDPRTNQAISEEGDSQPVTEISDNDIIGEFLPWLNAQSIGTWRLLSESEWEYVARAGTETPYYTGNSINCNTVASSGEANCNSVVGTSTNVASYAANAFGLFDTAGNIWEWVADVYQPSYAAAPTDGSAYTTTDTRRVVRGGSWLESDRQLRSALRQFAPGSHRALDIGFRLARTLP